MSISVKKYAICDLREATHTYNVTLLSNVEYFPFLLSLGRGCRVCDLNVSKIYRVSPAVNLMFIF